MQVITKPFRCPTCSYFFSLYAQAPKSRLPHQCPRCRSKVKETDKINHILEVM